MTGGRRIDDDSIEAQAGLAFSECDEPPQLAEKEHLRKPRRYLDHTRDCARADDAAIDEAEMQVVNEVRTQCVVERKVCDAQSRRDLGWRRPHRPGAEPGSDRIGDGPLHDQRALASLRTQPAGRSRQRAPSNTALPEHENDARQRRGGERGARFEHAIEHASIRSQEPCTRSNAVYQQRQVELDRCNQG